MTPRRLVVTALAALAVAGAWSVAGRLDSEAPEHSPRRPDESARIPLWTPPPPSRPQRRPTRPASVRSPAAIRWRRSSSHGVPWRGRLENGVQLPATTPLFFTWDPVRRTRPNRGWRRFGSDRLVRIVLHVLRQYARAHPRAARVGIGDVSRPRGGDFGARYGLPGHVSHQNGLDVDVYYPRLDRKEQPPKTPGQIDRELAQDLVDRFVRAGARKVFVGPGTRLTGPRDVVQVLHGHDNHMHVRIS